MLGAPGKVMLYDLASSVPLLHLQRDVLKPEHLDLVLKHIEKARREGHFVVAGNEGGDRDGKGYFSTLQWEPNAQNANPKDDDIPRILLPYVCKLPGVSQILPEPAKALSRWFVWTTNSEALADRQDTVFRWHKDGADGKLLLATIFSLYKCSSPADFKGAEVRVGTRHDFDTPVDVVLEPKRGRKKRGRKGHQIEYEYTDPRQYISMWTPHNSMSMMAGSLLPHAVQRITDPQITRYGCVLFFDVGRQQKYKGKIESLEESLRQQWISVLRTDQGRVTKPDKFASCPRCQKPMLKQNLKRHLVSHENA